MVNAAKLYMLKLVPKLKTNKLLKLLLVDGKTNNSIFMRFDMAGMAQTSKIALFPLWSLELE